MARVERIQWATDVDCPRCHAKSGEPCRAAETGAPVPDHLARVRQAEKPATAARSENPVARYSAEYQARNYKSTGGGRAASRGPDVPADVQRLDVHEPCFRCAARGACRHRPWLRSND